MLQLDDVTHPGNKACKHSVLPGEAKTQLPDGTNLYINKYLDLLLYFVIKFLKILILNGQGFILSFAEVYSSLIYV